MTSPRPDLSGSAGTGPAALCSCHTSAMSTPGGEIVVVRVFGDVDLTTAHVLSAALTEARTRRPGHLVVDVAGMGFCSVRGLTLLVHGGSADPDRPTEYLLSGVGSHVERFLALLWPHDGLPARYPSAGAAVLAAMAHQRDRHGAPERATRRGLYAVPGPDRHDEPTGGGTDEELTAQARAGDNGAYRELARRHRTRMYRSALRKLGSSDDPEDVADDIADRLRLALAAFGEAGPQ